MSNRSSHPANVLWSSIVIGSIVLLYSISEEYLSKHVDVETLGRTEDGRPYMFRNAGHQDTYSVYEMCKSDDRLEIVKKNQCKNRVAKVHFKNSLNVTGWTHLEIETFSDHSPFEQAYAAGYLEGIMTRKLIEYQLHNVLSTYCVGKEVYCEKLRSFIKENQAWTKKHLNRASAEDPYYSSIHRTYYQLQGLIDAYERRPADTRAIFEYHPIVFLNWMGEFYDLEVKFNGTRAGTEIPEKCSALVKLAPDNKDLYFSHVTMFPYHHMLRVIKLYKFGYDTKTYPGSTISVTSYPGMLSSHDDFHITSSKLAIMETTIGVYDKTKMSKTQAQEQFPCWIRSMTASQMSSTSLEWIQTFLRHHMGTYNNQWMIVDYKLFKPGQPLVDHTFYVLETMPGYYVYRDKSAELQKTTYHPSYNLPHYAEIIEYSALERFAQTFDAGNEGGVGGDYYRPGKSPRAKLFAREHTNVVDFESFTKLMRKIDFKKDELSRCKCEPAFSGEAAIAARGDLNDPDGKYEFAAMGHRNHGAVDFKGVNLERMNSFSFRAWGAPAWDQDNDVPPFQWSTFESRSPIRVPHRGHPDLFNFPFIEVQFDTKI